MRTRHSAEFSAASTGSSSPRSPWFRPSSPCVQLIIVVAIILFLQAADADSAFGRIFSGLDGLVESTVAMVSTLVTVRSFTRSWLTFTFMIAYVYLACLLILFILRLAITGLVYLVAWSNAFGLRSVIARERGI